MGAVPRRIWGRQDITKPTKMKAFIAVCAIAASVTAEANPALVYTTGHAVVPHVVAPAVYTQGGLVAHPDGAVAPDYTPAQKVAAATHLAAKVHTPVYSGVYSPYIHYGKRDAEAKPDAWGYGLGGVYAYGGVYGGYPYGGYHYGKRDAEAKPDAYFYGGYGYPYGGVHTYGFPYGGYLG